MTASPMATGVEKESIECNTPTHVPVIAPCSTASFRFGLYFDKVGLLFATERVGYAKNGKLERTIVARTSVGFISKWHVDLPSSFPHLVLITRLGFQRKPKCLGPRLRSRGSERSMRFSRPDRPPVSF